MTDEQQTPTRSLTTYRAMPQSVERRAYIVGGTLLRVLDRLGLRPAPGQWHIITEINVYRRRIAVYSVPCLSATDACQVIDKVVQSVGLNMMVMPPANSHIDFVADLYSRDVVDYYERV